MVLLVRIAACEVWPDTYQQQRSLTIQTNKTPKLSTEIFAKFKQKLSVEHLLTKTSWNFILLSANTSEDNDANLNNNSSLTAPRASYDSSQRVSRLK